MSGLTIRRFRSPALLPAGRLGTCVGSEVSDSAIRRASNDREYPISRAVGVLHQTRLAIPLLRSSLVLRQCTYSHVVIMMQRQSRLLRLPRRHFTPPDV